MIVPAFNAERWIADTLTSVRAQTYRPIEIIVAERPRPLLPRLTEAERAAHAAMVATLGEKALWLKANSAEKSVAASS